MTEKNIYTLDPETQRLCLEQVIKGMKNLISKREIWLNRPENKHRLTYGAVLQDTNEMREKLEEYQEKLKESELKIK